MKKALALVLALVLALSMAVSAFAELIVLPAPDAEDTTKTPIYVVDAETASEDVLYTNIGDIDFDKLAVTLETVRYIAINMDGFKNLEITANGNITAKVLEFDPEKMVLVDDATELDMLTYSVVVLGEEAATGLTYDEAVELAKETKKAEKLSNSAVKVVCEQDYAVIEITVANNFSAHYTEGTLKVTAVNKTTGKTHSMKLAVVNDVTIFEYEEVKYAAENNAKGAYLQLGAEGYSDYETALDGYSKNAFNGYNPDELRNEEYALVVSTTAFRAIEGKNLTVAAYKGEYGEISVTLKEVAAGQKGVNFFAFAEIEGVSVEDADRYPSAVSFGFLGDQIVKGKYEITVDLPINYYELRELFGIKVEEEDIINYYVVDENNNVVKTIKVDYMTDDISENVEFTVEGENEKLGWYTLCLEVPANETVEGEANPNTGAESVVGVVAALAVVSVATAAAVSLKK